jgi:ATP-dependent helicase/nuclease subunit A
LKKCAGIAEFSKTNSVEKTFNMMLSEFKFINNLHRIDRPAQNLEKIEFLSGMSKNFDTSGLSFSEFASFFKKIDEYNIKFKIEDTVINKNAVQLMTHHKSKGLEWPVVFIAGISGNKEGVPDTTNGRFTKLSGIEFKCFEGNQVRSFYNRYNRIVNRFEDIGEEIRLFYVALTRARETLYMVCDKEVYEDYAVPCYNLTTFLNLLKNTKFEPKEETADITYNAYEGENLVVTVDKTNSKIVEFCSVFEEKITRRASHKIEETEISAELQSKLDMGNELHEYMETINFRTMDTSHIKNQKYKRFIDKVLNNSVFADCKSDNFIDAYKEYEFIGDNLHGFVDLFLLYEDKIKIIDYKLKDISNPDYKKQLKTYKEYLSSVFEGKTISTYLISLIEGRCEEINTDEE